MANAALDARLLIIAPCTSMECMNGAVDDSEKSQLRPEQNRACVVRPSVPQTDLLSIFRNGAYFWG